MAWSDIVTQIVVQSSIFCPNSYLTHLSKCIRAQLAGAEESTNMDACGVVPCMGIRGPMVEKAVIEEFKLHIGFHLGTNHDHEMFA